MIQKIVFLIVVFLTNIIQCITGFAGTVLAMPFSLMLVGYDIAKPILNVLGLAASAFIVIKEYKNIKVKELSKILAFMILGMVISYFIKDFASGYESILYKCLGAIIIVVAVFNAVLFYSKKEMPEPNIILSIIILIGAGIVHGLFVCGGMLVVIYANAKFKEKSEFRATLSAVWLVLNSIILVSDIRAGYMVKDTLVLLLISLAVLAGSLIVGNLIYKKMSRSVFLQLTYALMIISGVSLLVK